MDAVTAVLLVFLGLGVGAGATYIYTRMQLRQVLEHVNAENVRVNGERLTERSADQEKIKELQTELSAVREDAARFRQEWQTEKKKREAAEDISERVHAGARETEAAMAKTIDAKDRAMGKLLEEIGGLNGRIAELEKVVEEQKSTFDNGLVFVHGNHYLPGSVIRSLTRKKESK